MSHQPISLTDNPTLPMAFSSRLRKGAQGWIYCSDQFAIVIEETPITVGQAAQMMAAKTRTIPESAMQYTAAASVFYRRSKNPIGPSRLPIAVVALEHMRFSTPYEQVGCLGRLMGVQPRPLEVFVGVWTASGRNNLGAIPNVLTREAQRGLLLAKATEIVGIGADCLRLAGDTSRGPDCDAMQ
jgi:hypothetical protein